VDSPAREFMAFNLSFVAMSYQVVCRVIVY